MNAQGAVRQLTRFTNLKDGTGVSAIVDWLCANLRYAD